MRVSKLLVALFAIGFLVAASGCALLAYESTTSPSNQPPATQQPKATTTPLVLIPSVHNVERIGTPEPLADRQSCTEIRGSEYRSDTEHEWFKANCLAPVSAARPPGPPAVPGAEVVGERWVLIDLASQTATAMIGDQALYTALVTSGKDGWETPRGTFYVGYRVANETMTSASIGAEEYYVLKDVLYTQYFTNAGHALHLNYWQPDSVFGNTPSSHGCIGMRMADAKFFWDFLKGPSRVTIV